MKELWTDLKSFVTVSMVVLLAVVIVGNLFGKALDENILLLFTNLITATFTYYFSKKESTSEVEQKDNSNPLEGQG